MKELVEAIEGLAFVEIVVLVGAIYLGNAAGERTYRAVKSRVRRWRERG